MFIGAHLWFFRAGYAHAGVLLLMSLLYHHYMEQTNLSPSIKVAAAVAVLTGILAQSGGFFLHMLVGRCAVHRDHGYEHWGRTPGRGRIDPGTWADHYQI